MIINDTAKCVNIIRSINYLDSSLFGLGIDIFKVRIMVSSTLSSELIRFGFDERFENICCDFSQIRNLELEIKKSVFGPPYLEDGQLAAIDLADFNFKTPKIRKTGSTSTTDRLDCYGTNRDIYEIQFTFDYGMIRFEFVELEISVFDPENLR